MVLVGYDDSDSARDALALGRLLARASDTPLVLACVYADEPILSDEHRAAQQREAEGKLGPALDELVVEGLAAHGIAHASSSPASGLRELAASERPEAVVIGSRHRHPLGKLLPGAVGERLLHGSPCPVAVAPRGFAGYAPSRLSCVGIGFDGSPESWRALEEAARLAQAAGARLRVLTAFEPPGMQGLDPAGFERLVRSQRGRAERLLNEALAAVSDQVRATGLVLTGDPARMLAAIADSERLDRLVVGSRRRGPIAGTMLGGVSSRLARKIGCPLLAIPRAVAAPTAAQAFAPAGGRQRDRQSVGSRARR